LLESFLRKLAGNVNAQNEFQHLKNRKSSAVSAGLTPLMKIEIKIRRARERQGRIKIKIKIKIRIRIRIRRELEGGIQVIGGFLEKIGDEKSLRNLRF